MNNNFIAELINLLGKYNINDYSIKKKDGKLIIEFTEAVTVKETTVEREFVDSITDSIPDSARIDYKTVDFGFVNAKDKKPKIENKSITVKKNSYNGKDLLENGIEWVDSEIEKTGSFNKFCNEHGVKPSTFKYWYDKAKLAKAEESTTKEETDTTDIEVKEIVPEIPVEDTLYKGEKFTDFEVDAIKSYLAHEFTPKECAELLNIDTKKFHNMVNRFKRAKNLK